MKKGEIWLVELPSGAGSEQKGTRPAVISRKIDGTRICVVIPLTANLHALRLPYTLAISSDRKNGLLAESVALIFQLRAIDTSRIKRKLGTLKPAVLKRVDSLLAKLLSL